MVQIINRRRAKTTGGTFPKRRPTRGRAHQGLELSAEHKHDEPKQVVSLMAILEEEGYNRIFFRLFRITIFTISRFRRFWEHFCFLWVQRARHCPMGMLGVIHRTKRTRCEKNITKETSRSSMKRKMEPRTGNQGNKNTSNRE